MKTSIRMIGIATTFLWIFLISFFISAVYSVKDLHFNMSEPQMGVNQNNEVYFSLPITITNNGFYSIGSFMISTRILDENGFQIAENSTVVPVIRKGENTTAFHTVMVNISDLLQNSQVNYLINDSEFLVKAAIGMSIAQIIPVQVATNLTVPWGAPFYNLTFGTPQYSDFNTTHCITTIPISFENHAFFDLNGTIQIKMYNDSDLLVGSGETTFEVPQHSPYNGIVEFYVSTTDLTETGYLEVYFLTPLLDYGPLVVSYG
ncbi:MAG TPA: hypothetical protein ENG19_01375 [Candidatus Bathyarchaeota archaeon]|nr:hypothetical protein [Candidatus Bathyarchaeota archaeon]